MNVEDSTTLTVGPVDLGDARDRGGTHVPALTILWHPELDRVGEMAPLPELLTGAPAALTRDQPLFAPPGSTRATPVQHRSISRDAVVILSKGGPSVTLESGPGASTLAGGVEVGGLPLRSKIPLRAEDLRSGIVITAGWCVFCLHTVMVPLTRTPSLGLVGVGDGVEAVRRQITTVAPLSGTVLVRGESGSGKELVARALHENGPRRGRPFVAVNMSSVLPARAGADLFGFEKGAYTGATTAAPGYFRAAEGGTLFLDEIGKTHPDVQPMLLRVLEDRLVHPLGSARPRSVDVRLIAATDARLEQAVAAGGFDAALYNRLTGGLTIALPPLRERREDVGLLFLHCLRQALGPEGAHRLVEEPRQREEWLPARAVAAICAHPLPGNVRNLQGLAANLALRTKAFKYVVEALKDFGAPESASPPVRLRLSAMTLAQIIDALDQAGWSMSQAARNLGVEPSTLLRRLRKDPHVYGFAKLSVAALERWLADLGGDPAALSRELGVSEELLARRLGPRT